MTKEIKNNYKIPGITYQEYCKMTVAEWRKYQNGVFPDIDEAIFTTYAVETVWNETERCRTYAGAIKKLKPLKTALPEEERTSDYFFNLALDILLCVDILFCYDSTDEPLGRYCNRLTTLVPQKYKRECERIFTDRLRYGVAQRKQAV